MHTPEEEEAYAKFSAEFIRAADNRAAEIEAEEDAADVPAKPQLVAANDNGPRPRFSFTWIDHIAESTPKELLIKGTQFGVGEFTVVSGLPGSGKSVVAGEGCGQQPVWVIIDTLTRTFGPGDQNASKDMGKFIAACDVIRLATGAHVTLIHHTAWTGERGKGAIDLDGAVDASFIVKKSGKQHTLECTGTNDGGDGPVITFRMISVEVGVNDDGEVTTAPVVKAEASPAADLIAAHDHGRIASAVLDSLRTGIAADGIEPDGAGASIYPAGIRMIAEETWRAAYDATEPTAKPDTMSKRFKRAKRELTDLGSVKNVGQWFWPDMPDGHGQRRTNPALSADTE